MPVLLQNLNTQSLVTLAPERTVFFIPIGTLEGHGPYLPFGLKLTTAEKVCLALATRLEQELPGWTGVLLPTLSLSVEAHTADLQTTVRAHVLRDYLVDVCAGLYRKGFSHFACYSSFFGPKQLTTIEEAHSFLLRKAYYRPLRFLGTLAAKRGEKKAKPELVSISSGIIQNAYFRKQSMSSFLFFPDPKEHGGELDTSIALALDPLHVLPGFKATSNPLIKAQPKSALKRYLYWLLNQAPPHWGTPHSATAEKGQQHLQRQIDEVFTQLKVVWMGGRNLRFFKTWAAYLPWNRSLFQAWILSLGIFAVLVAWLLLNIQMLMEFGGLN